MSKRLFLKDIVRQKVKRLKDQPLIIEALMQQIAMTKTPPSFYEAMARNGLSIIGEIKKASPSKGLIKEDFDPVALAKQYAHSVDAISVLTEEDFFMGHARYLSKVVNTVDLPILYKDFIVQANQVYHARAIGASCILLIVAILTDVQLREYSMLAKSLGMDVLVETHTKDEIRRALKGDVRIIGINNRNLKTFKTDIRTTLKLRRYVPKDRLVISESGIHKPEDVAILKKVDIDGILVGESFMRGDIGLMAKAFKEAYNG